jgi:hypothetical protein
MKTTTKRQFRVYWESIPEDQRRAAVLRHIKLNMAYRKIDTLPARLRPLAHRLWQAAKYQRPEDIETVIKIAKAHGIGSFSLNGPASEESGFSSDTRSIEQRGQA